MFSALACPLTSRVLTSRHMYSIMLDFTAALLLRVPHEPPGTHQTAHRLPLPACLPPQPALPRALLLRLPSGADARGAARGTAVPRVHCDAPRGAGLQEHGRAGGNPSRGPGGPAQVSQGLRAPHTPGAIGSLRPMGEGAIAVAVATHGNAWYRKCCNTPTSLPAGYCTGIQVLEDPPCRTCRYLLLFPPPFLATGARSFPPQHQLLCATRSLPTTSHRFARLTRCPPPLQHGRRAPGRGPLPLRRAVPLRHRPGRGAAGARLHRPPLHHRLALVGPCGSMWRRVCVGARGLCAVRPLSSP